MYRQALELEEKVLGQEHPDILRSMKSLAEILRDQGMYEQEEEIYQQVLELKEKALGKDHPEHEQPGVNAEPSRQV
jgi:tetratricopeptide (TPR) repeat protein